MMILIISNLFQEQTIAKLTDHIRAQGGDPIVLDLAAMQQQAALSIATGPQHLLRLPERTIDLTQVRSAFLWRSWRPNRLDPQFAPLADQRDTWSFFEHEWLGFHKGMALLLSRYPIFCVNPPPYNSAYEEKCAQLHLAAEVGLRIPPTLYTADLALVRAFYEEHHGAIIYKPFRAYLNVSGTPGRDLRAIKLFTNRVDRTDLTEGASYLPTPGIFQPYIPKQLELRVVVIGHRLFTCAIHSQASTRAKDDWRRYGLPNTPHTPYDLPDTIAQRILRLVQRMGLVFGSVDLILTPDGEYVFLEINPSGQFDWIAQLSGLPIYQHLAAMLIAGRPDYHVVDAVEVSHAA